MLVKDIESVLRNKPEYDDQWIDWAAPILNRFCSITESDLAELSTPQIKVLWDGLLRYNEDDYIIDVLLTKGLNATQMMIVLFAYMDDLSRDQIELLADKSIPFSKMNYLAKALIDGLNLFELLDITKFSYEQIYEIYAAFKSKIDYSLFMDSGMDASTMKIIREALLDGRSVKIDGDNVIIDGDQKI